ncbi:MAG: mechanosensitive ion channel family protein [Tannerellaceae bacterium]|nr:mechanosensitive ion channel family protein [Tannerellaceae bacterium]
MMDFIREILNNDEYKIWVGIFFFLVSLLVIYIIYKSVLKILKKTTSKTNTLIDDFVIDLLKLPFLWLVIWILLKVFSNTYLKNPALLDIVSNVNNILLIMTTGWIVIKMVRVVFYHFQHKLDIASDDNLIARQNLTRMKIFEGIIVGLITVVIVSICLMTFDKVRSIGISLLTSAGIAGIIVGLAAQKSIGAVLAGIQIAITQPIRLDDVVVVEGEWGRIEEITLTYVVVKIWDERRLVLPVTYFLEKPFQNWTRSTSTLLGTVYLYVDYKFPVAALRNKLQELLVTHPKWDRRVANIQVTDTKQNYKELRVLLSSINSSINWDLRTDIREKLIDFIQENYPDCFVKSRITGSISSSDPD